MRGIGLHTTSDDHDDVEAVMIDLPPAYSDIDFLLESDETNLPSYDDAIGFKEKSYCKKRRSTSVEEKDCNIEKRRNFELQMKMFRSLDS